MEPIEIRAAAGQKRALYFGAPARPLFGFYHSSPDDAPHRDVGVVLVNPVGTDFTRSDRTYRRLAERLAATGFPCLRFDLYGTGDSGGDELTPDLFRAWLDDVGAAVEELRGRSGAAATALVGLRIGATLAYLHAAERGDVQSLVLWSPCVTGAGFLGEVKKLHKLYARIEPQMAAAPPLQADGDEALGTFFPRPLAGQLAEVDLLRATGRPARRALVIDGGNVQGRDPLVSRLRELGATTDLESHPGHKFLVTVSHRSAVPEEVLDSIVRWLGDGHPAGRSAHRPAERPSGPSPAGERPIVFGEGRPLFGILTPADPRRAKPDRPQVILANAGCVNRVGPHRTYVKMARRWAELGFDVLRADLSGIGDSPVEPGTSENLTYPPSGLLDLRAAMRALGGGRAIVAGLCSGGDYAFQLGAHDPNVAGAWLLNPRTFCVLALAAVESGAPPAHPVDEVPRTLRTMAERGVDTLLVVSRNDPGVAYVDTHAGGAMRELVGSPRFERVDLDGADHSFTPVAIQERVSDLLTGHLEG